MHKLIKITRKWGNLKTLDEGPEENPDGVALPQQLDQTRCSEEPKKANIEEVFLKFKILKYPLVPILYSEVRFVKGDTISKKRQKALNY